MRVRDREIIILREKSLKLRWPIRESERERGNEIDR